jgi:geranylgeranyl diphosphate synthase, type II
MCSRNTPRATALTTMDDGLKEILTRCRSDIVTALEAALPDEQHVPRRLHSAMRYAVLNGGKRVRAALVYMTGNALSAPRHRLDAPACAVELVHAYSLVHDDLPAMDDDDLRRGLPTCHIAFDEATALLAGDALQTLAFELLTPADQDVEDYIRASAMVNTLATASGAAGMAGGQAIDLAAVGKVIAVEELRTMHELKTGALIRASIRLGALCADNVGEDALLRLDRYGHAIGLAFQIQDDILDVEGDTATLGKRQGADEALDKPTYPALLGLAQAKRLASEMHSNAMTALATFGPEADPLRSLSAYIIERES